MVVICEPRLYKAAADTSTDITVEHIYDRPFIIILNDKLIKNNCISLQVVNGYLSTVAKENPGELFNLPSHLALKWAANTSHEWMFEKVINYYLLSNKANIYFLMHKQLVIYVFDN